MPQTFFHDVFLHFLSSSSVLLLLPVTRHRLSSGYWPHEPSQQQLLRFPAQRARGAPALVDPIRSGTLCCPITARDPQPRCAARFGAFSLFFTG
jgi:hypothetical protein